MEIVSGSSEESAFETSLDEKDFRKGKPERPTRTRVKRKADEPPGNGPSRKKKVCRNLSKDTFWISPTHETA